VANIRKGGYILKDAAQPRAVLIATGSEVALAMQAAVTLAAQNIAVRVVSMPSTNVFDAQDKAYKISVLGENVPRLAIEAGVSDFWRKYVGLEGDVIGIDQFGESAPADQLFKLFGFTVENVVAKVTNLIS
jgi:transketolase